ncbi:hypothetical protein [Streptomyces sp. SID12488]|uniref:hypothetical protein n=1 Tax=Streptomyces sp. SID12488 TaxID=2706040 RepID=UPI001943C086|nr:hypothetical protein [Streptomyces sp. SID12488]
MLIALVYLPLAVRRRAPLTVLVSTAACTLCYWWRIASTTLRAVLYTGTVSRGAAWNRSTPRVKVFEVYCATTVGG